MEGWEGGCGRPGLLQRQGPGAGQSPQAADPVRSAAALLHFTKLILRLQPRFLPSSSSFCGAVSPGQLRWSPCAPPGDPPEEDSCPGALPPSSSSAHQPHLCPARGPQAILPQGPSPTVGQPAPQEVWVGEGGVRWGCHAEEWRRMAGRPHGPGAAERAHDGRRSPPLLGWDVPVTLRTAEEKMVLCRAPRHLTPDREGPPGAELALTCCPGLAELEGSHRHHMDTRGRPRLSTPKEPPGLQGLWPPPAPRPRKTSQRSVASAHPGCPHLQVGVLGPGPAWALGRAM